MPRLLISLGIMLVIAGVFWHFGAQWGLGRLPGDIRVQRENMTFHFPLMTSIVLSVVLTLIMWLVGRFWR